MTTDEATKRCSKCKEQVPLSRFYKNNSRLDGLASQCKPCTAQLSRSHYERNRQQYYSRNQRQRETEKSVIREMKANTPCADCKQQFHWASMEFDHVDPPTKEFDIGRRGGKSRRKVYSELRKCEIVCANCHRLRTYRRNYSENGDGTIHSTIYEEI